MDTSGKKADLVERLTEALGDQTESTAPKSKKVKKEPEQTESTAPKSKKVKKEPEQTEFQKAKELLQAQDG